MRLLLDTHTFLWFSRASPELNERARDLIEDTGNDFFLSVASPWETGIKVSTGKLIIGRPINIFFEDRMGRNRMLIAQSLVKDIPIVSADAAFDAYGIVRLW